MELTTELIAKRFDKYNKLYFNNSLPKPEFKIINSYNNCGSFRFLENRQKTKIHHELIEISGNYDWTDKQLRDILVHEMIHFYLIRNKRENKRRPHSGEFLKMATEFNEKYGMNITKRVDLSKLKQKKKDLPKRRGFFASLFS